MDFTAGIIVWICGVALVAGFTQGLTGFGLAVLCMPLLSMQVPVRVSVPIAALCGGSVTIPIVVTLRRHVLWRPALMLSVCAVPGIWAGARLLAGVPPAWILGAMGLILTMLGIFNLCHGRVPAALNGRGLLVASGFVSGAVGAATAAPGPPVIAYVGLQPWDVRQAKAVMNVFFLLQSLVVVPVYYGEGVLTADVGRAFAWAAPFVAAGLAAGLCLARVLQDKGAVMRAIVNTAILLLGVSLLAKACMQMNR
jgi:uncharacterized membrane protein YfcA